jgi:hypothetical protein
VVQQPAFDVELLTFLQDTFQEQRAANASTISPAAPIDAQQAAVGFGLEPESQFSRNVACEDLLMD